MGEIADMMLEGLLDEETGEYIGDINEGVYGLQAPGFPISYERGDAVPDPADHQLLTRRVSCPDCGKRVKEVGLWQHRRDVHNTTQEN